MSEPMVCALLDSDGRVVNTVLGDQAFVDGWDELPDPQPEFVSGAARLRVLTEEDRAAGVGLGWRVAGNGRWVDERPAVEPHPDAPPV